MFKALRQTLCLQTTESVLTGWWYSEIIVFAKTPSTCTFGQRAASSWILFCFSSVVVASQCCPRKHELYIKNESCLDCFYSFTALWSVLSGHLCVCVCARVRACACMRVCGVCVCVFLSQLHSFIPQRRRSSSGAPSQMLMTTVRFNRTNRPLLSVCSHFRACISQSHVVTLQLIITGIRRSSPLISQFS